MDRARVALREEAGEPLTADAAPFSLESCGEGAHKERQLEQASSERQLFWKRTDRDT